MIINALYAMAGSAGFGLLAQLRWRVLPGTSLGAGLSWLVYESLLNATHAKVLSIFAASFFAAVYAEIAARITHRPATTFVLCGVVSLVPGAGMYYTMAASVRENVEEMLAIGLETLVSAMVIATAIALVASLVMMLQRVLRLQKKV